MSVTNRKFSEEAEQEIARRKESGESAFVLAEEHGCTQTTVVNIARRHGVTVPAHGGKAWSPPKDQEQELIRRYKSGESLHRISKDYGSVPRTIGRWLTRKGIKPERRYAKGRHHGRWTGGEQKHVHGYRMLWIPADHPLGSMRQQNGYVPEHRLVMAQELGRPLAPWETVHHKDGVRDNNAPENLQLRSGQHGNGVAYRCCDCGSHNVAPMEL